jgi:hypothetical protein
LVRETIVIARQKEKEHRFWNAVAILLFVVLCAISMALWRRVVCELMQCLWCAGHAGIHPRRSYELTTLPPFGCNTWPLIYEASSLARNT